MFTLNEVTLRPLEFDDIEMLYDWSVTLELEMLTAWGPRQSRDHFHRNPIIYFAELKIFATLPIETLSKPR